MKFDTLIAATAHALRAHYLVTANSRDFVTLLTAVGSSVSVLTCDKSNEFTKQMPLFLKEKAAADTQQE